MRIYDLNKAELTKLRKNVSRKGGGMQGALYLLSQSISPDERRLVVGDELFDTFHGYLIKLGKEGGWQGRIPAQMLDDLRGVRSGPHQTDLLL